MNKKHVLEHATESMRGVLNQWDVLSDCGDYGMRKPGDVPWGGKRESRMETLARSLLAATPFIVNGIEVDAVNLSKFYANHILTLAQNSTFEPLVDRYDQATVEVAGICACMLTLEIFEHDLLGSLSPTHQEIVISWIKKYEHALVMPNNWCIFPLVIGSWLRHRESGRTGMPLKRIDASQWQCVDRFHVGSGWYRDGFGGEIDYYTSWSFQWYSLILVMSKSLDTSTAQTVIQRSTQFAERLAAKLVLGGLPAMGRSQCYREAASAALALVSFVAKPIHCGHQLLEINWQQWKNNIGFQDVTRDYYSCSASEMWRFKWYWQALLPDSDIWWEVARYTIRTAPINAAERSESQLMRAKIHSQTVRINTKTISKENI